MGATYQGQQIRNQRPAKQGDRDFRPGEEQVVITLQDGTEKTVAKSELQPGQSQRQGKQADE